MRLRRRYVVALLLVIVLIVVWLLTRCEAPVGIVRMVTVGDMDCDPADPDFAKGGAVCRHQAVSDLAVALKPTVFLGLGDFQYELPKADAYQNVYGPAYGRLKSKTIPVYGNQEYKVQDANTFTAYFGDRIKDTKGYWSQDIGAWHIVVLNSNCSAVAGGCGSGSPQQAWLTHDLAATDRKCVLAAWHHPRWSTGIAGPDPRTADLYQTLYDHKVELVLSGHEADYERFPPLNPAGHPDPHGVRQYVVGTGGQAHYRPAAADDAYDERGNPIATAGRPAGDFVDYTHHGVLELILESTSWQWRWHPLEAADPITDSGTATCF
ncbi:metallophosphoesterase [Actinoplanes sp. N902-109]|uniref:metallophosphoesterase family protein n=1 Tax=Actinoplanes sp. (strain N902-109) TaxID=649831 RepID=UPI0003293507|nr:metallophosphoesterase [Actinoplanes sp. N902-109]AGL14298.1 alkaline phosphatase [Actinoplanes sp. N902-109]